MVGRFLCRRRRRGRRRDSRETIIMRFLFFLFVCRLFVGKRKKRTLKNKNDKNMTAFFVQILVCVSKERDDLSSLSFFLLFWRKSRLMTTTLFFGGDYVPIALYRSSL